ncbi:MAG TPA: hypothetical protein VNU94_09050 [Acidobacteriaceae bacterium]|jgi:hypothetical protein|nr:hypothetical protein [Acidobacteriaceae bacterium]
MFLFYPSGFRGSHRAAGRLDRLKAAAQLDDCACLSAPMRLPFPERIIPWHAGCFAALLCAFELLLGTPPLFAGCVFAYIMMATIAFNLAGGLYRASGAYIFANSILSLILAQCAKVVFGESADSNLRDPMTTILVFTAGMAGMLLAVFVSRRLIPKVALLELGDVPEDSRQIAIGCIALGIGMPFIAGFLGNNEPGSISSALNQFTQFLPLGIVLSTYDEIRSSGGRRSLNGFIVFGGLFMIAFWGILATSKQGLFTPLVTYGVACAALRYKFRPSGIAAMAIVVFFTVYYLVPYSQVVRNYTRSIYDISERMDTSIYWLEHLDEVRAENDKSSEDALGIGPHYYTQNRGFLERLSMIGIDDSLIDVADNGPKFGYQPMIFAVENIIPHFVWPDKPNTNYNNVYGHEVGILADEDEDTSVSFGPSADGFNMGGWPGVFLLLPIVMTLLFAVVDSVSGSIKKSPWGLIYTVLFLHIGPEGSLGACVGAAFQTTVVLVLTVFTARHALPLIGSLFFPERRKSVLMRNVRDFPKAAVADPPEAAGGPL